MALVLLPCDLPSWPAVERHLDTLACLHKSDQLVDIMCKVHGLCCVSLDPDENDRSDIAIFCGFQTFLDVGLSVTERDNFFDVTLPSLVRYATRLRIYKPADGLHYSLQQQADCSNLDRKFVASLVANAFFSTFPRRTRKTHPTLQDCNFARFFAQLNRQDQQTKLRNFLNYFDRIARCEPTGKIVFIRKVTSKMAELDFDDWLQCSKLLCPVTIRHDDRMKQMESGSVKVCFGSNRVGGLVLDGGGQQEDLMFGAFPELFVTLLSTELMEANEACTVHGLFPVGGSSSGRKLSKETSDADEHLDTHVCLTESMRFESEGHLFKESMVRELNKAFTAFRERAESSVRLRPIGKSLSATPPKDLSPIQEDGSPSTVVIENRMDDFDPKTQDSDNNSEQGSIRDSVAFVRDLMASGWPCSNWEPSKTMRKRNGGNKDVTGRARLTSRLHRPFVQNIRQISRGDSEDSFYVDCREDNLVTSRCGGLMFQRPLMLSNSSPSSSMPIEQRKCPVKPSPLDGLTSMEASFASCYTHKSSSGSSLDDDDRNGDDDDEDGFQSCSEELEDVSGSQNIDSRHETMTENEFPSELEDGTNWGCRVESGPVNCRRRMKPSISCCTTDSTDDGSYPMDASLEDSVWRPRRRFLPRRAASTGFTMDDEDIDNDDDDDDDEEDIFVGDAQLEHERDWLASFRHRSANPSRCSMSRRDSSRYSFSSDFSSDLEDIYDHFEEKMTEGPVRDDPTIRSRLGDRLKRTLSDSLASFPRMTMPMPRSLSLTEKMQQERLNVAVRVPLHDPYVFYGDAPPYVAGGDDHPMELWKSRTSSCHVGHLVGTADVAIEQNLCDVDESIELSLTLPRTGTLKRLPSQLSVWWNYNSVYDFCVPLCPAGQTSTSEKVTTMTNGTLEQRKPEGWPLRRMSSKKFGKNNSEVGSSVLPDGDDLFLHVPSSGFNVCRRSKSTTDYDELIRSSRTLSTRNSVDGIAKSSSLKDVPTTKHLLPRTCTMIPEFSSEMEWQLGLRKWQATFDLNQLAADNISDPICGSRSSNVDSNPPRPSELGKKRSEDGLLANARRIVESNVVSVENVRSQSRPEQPIITSQRCLSDNVDGNMDDGDACRPIETGNWSYRDGNHEDDAQSSDPQLMALVVWMAASRADAPCVIYHTGGDQRIVKLSTVSRVLLDRRWSVGRIARAILSHYASPTTRRKSLTTEQDVDLLQSLLPKETDF